jgi:DNA-binding transcriptional LysR family regulator
VADGVRVHVADGEDEQLVEELREGRHDLVLTTQRPRGSALAVTPLAEEEHLLVAAPAWAARVEARAEGVPVCAALETVPLVSTAGDMPVVRRYWRTQYGRQHPAVGPAMTVPSLHAVIAAVRAGAGYSVLPRSLCEADLAAGTLVQLEEPERPRTTTLLLVQRPGAEQNSATLRIASALQEAAHHW